MINIANSLGVGSGVDSIALVDQIATAARAPREAALRTREAGNAARLSAIASTRSAIDTFADALGELFASEEFAATPLSTNSAVAGAVRVPGSRPAAGGVTLNVTQLARAQTWRSATVADVQASIGAGGFSLTGPGGTAMVDIIPGNDTLGGLAAAINAAAVGVSARVIVDADGARLLLTGAAGASGGFALTPTAATSPELSATLSAMTEVQSGADALVSVDTVPLRFASNQIDGLLPGVTVNLAGTGTTRIDVPPPPRAMAELMEEFVSAYNDLRGALNRATAGGAAGADAGPLAGDARVREVMRQLGTLTTTTLAAPGSTGPQRLADLGLKTGRDGRLTLDKTRFEAVFAESPEAVRAMLDPETPSASAPGLAGLMDGLRDRLNATDGPLDAAADGYSALKTRLARERDRMVEADDRLRAQLSTQFTAMERQVALLNASRSAIEQQIAAWQASQRT